MIDNIIDIEKALLISNNLFIDLRSPIEYAEAHIPGAVNIPLLENEERVLVGTIHNHQSSELAVDKGFEIVAPKLPQICSMIKKYGKTKNIILYCWRGGMRSSSISKVLSILRTKHYLLKGGYKAFRKHVNDFFCGDYPQEIVVLHGLTGVGKTEILQQLKEKGLPVIDLEDLANHRGSVFGSIGLGTAPSQKQFEGRLFMEYLRYKDCPRILVECESQRIGFLNIPGPFYKAMQAGKKILIYDSLENRVDRLVATYTNGGLDILQQQFNDSIDALTKYIGNKKVKVFKELLQGKKYNELARILLLDYYDPLYRYPDNASNDFYLCLDNRNREHTINSIENVLSDS